MTQLENEQIKELNSRFDSFEKGFDIIKDNVQQISDAILGNKFNEKSAYKTRLEQLEEFKAKVEIKILKAQIWGTAIGFLACALLEFLYKYSSVVANFKK